jgi:hypothetical protein
MLRVEVSPHSAYSWQSQPQESDNTAFVGDWRESGRIGLHAQYSTGTLIALLLALLVLFSPSVPVAPTLDQSYLSWSYTFSFALMATTPQTEQTYSGREFAGVAVSPSPSTPSQTRLLDTYLYPLGARRLRYALVNHRLEHVRYPRSMYRRAREVELACVWLTLGLGVLRCQQYAVSVHPTKRSSFAHTLGYTSFPFSYATLFKALVRSSTFRGFLKTVYTPADYAQPKRLLSRSLMYENILFSAKTEY